MSGSNNFLQFNPAKNNILSDVDYTASTVRQQGIQSGIRTAAASNLHNKLFYQLSTMVSALGQMLAGKGYTISDADISTLVTQLNNVMTLADMTPYCLTTQMESYVGARLIPVGSVIAWPSDTPPTGFLECDGSSLSRVTYASLYSVIGVKYGNVDSNHFNLPDFRGYFLRGWAHGSTVDPDRATRTNRGDGTVGDYVGTKQTGQVIQHAHSQICDGRGGPANTYGAYSAEPVQFMWEGMPTGNYGGSETRPININVMFCIKY